MSDILDCCGCCLLCCACVSICDRICIYIPWGRRRKTQEDIDDEIYAADVEQQVERERWAGSHMVQLQPPAQAMRNPYDKVKDRQTGSYTVQSQAQALPNPYDKGHV